jgi:arabinose-5-phosphate isomerase
MSYDFIRIELMNDQKKQIVDEAINVLRMEANSVEKLVGRVNHDFVKMVELICRCRGRMIISGIGKSGIIAHKIVATLNSTGTRSLFLHPVEAMHGDLGIVSRDDVFLALSTSGETDELNVLLDRIKSVGCPIIAFTGNTQSTLAKGSDIVVDVGVEKEACPMGLAPTCSTTAMLAMGDALAVVLINQKGFKSDDFKRFHPGGALGQRLAGKVDDMMLTGDAIPSIKEGESLSKAIAEMNRHSLGIILILTSANTLTGVITDGDIRRAVARQMPLHTLKVDQLMSKNPYRLQTDTPAYDALNMMEQHQITVLPIVDTNKKVIGILHLHDVLGKGEFKFNGR